MRASFFTAREGFGRGQSAIASGISSRHVHVSLWPSCFPRSSAPSNRRWRNMSSKVRSSSAPARLEKHSRAAPSRSRPTETPRSWADISTIRTLEHCGLSHAAAASGPSRDRKSWEAAQRVQHPSGSAVALSADGNTAITSGYTDNSAVGAAWIFIRDSGVWSAARTEARRHRRCQCRLPGSPELHCRRTATHGGRGLAKYDGGVGATWVFTRSGGVWTQQGLKLVGTGAIGSAGQGSSVAVSADGNTADRGAGPR